MRRYFLCLAVLCLHSYAVAQISPEDLLSLLQARDAQCDNINLRCIETQEWEPSWQFIATMPLEERRELFKDGTVFTDRTRNQITIRGSETTITYEWDDTLQSDKPSPLTPVQFQRESNISGLWKTYVNEGGERDLTIRPVDPSIPQDGSSRFFP